MSKTATPSSILAADAVIGALLSRGVKDFAYCPGSRNAPFAYVLDAYESRGLVHVHPFAEERGAGFWAIGAIKATGDPVAVVTTSGTAVAELHPAMEEASHQGLPLLAITADRPFEAHGVGANQTTKQVGIFADAPVVELDIPALDRPSEQLLGQTRARVIRTVMRAQGQPGLPGPAHINVAFREPLAPSVPVEISSTSLQSEGPPYVFAPTGSTTWSQVVDPELQTLLVVGDVGSVGQAADVRAVVDYAAELGIPMIAEPSSGMCDAPNWLPHGPLIADRLGAQVEQIVVLGRPTLSRPIARLLAGASPVPSALPGPVAPSSSDASPGASPGMVAPGATPTLSDVTRQNPPVRKVVVGDSPGWPDSSGTATVYVERLVPDWDAPDWLGAPDSADDLADVPDRGPEDSSADDPADDPDGPTALTSNDAWAQYCIAVSDQAFAALSQVLDQETGRGAGLNQLCVAREIWESPGNFALWLGASGTVRSFDAAAGDPGRPSVYANRGLAGIDGTVASALGLQFGLQIPVRVVLGDLTFCYDIPSLAARPDGEQDIQIIVLDDGGASIFASLEHGRIATGQMYERFFRVSQTIDIAGVARACGWEVHEAARLGELRDLLREPIRGRSVIRVQLGHADNLVPEALKVMGR